MKSQFQQFQQQQQQLQQQRQRMAQGAAWMEQQKQQQMAGQAGPAIQKEIDQRFSLVEQEAARLRQQYTAGKLSEDDLNQKLSELMVQDGSGAWWMVGTESGHWYRFDGTRWVPGVPPGRGAAGIGPMAGVKASPTGSRRKPKSIFDFIMPLIGGLFFFYIVYSVSHEILLSNGSEVAEIGSMIIGIAVGMGVFIYAVRE